MPSDPTAYTLVASNGGYQLDMSTQELRANLQSQNDEVKLETLRAIIVSTLNGESHASLLMPIIQYVLPSKNKQLKKMLQFYWEVCPKLDAEGKLKQEMILVCNAIRNDLQHPNEYIRGSTLRFLQKIKEQEILEPLIPTVRQCLEHRHSYVRKNAVMAIWTIYQRHEQLIVDAPELMEEFLANESDATCKRNALLMLVYCAPERAVEYLSSVMSQVPVMDELMQLAVIELIRQESRNESANLSEYIQVVSELLASSSHAVKYEAAITLAGLAHNVPAVKAVASALIELTVQESDNNVKLIVLDRLDGLRQRHDHVLDPLVIELLRVLSSSDMDVRKKVLDMALEMMSIRTVEEVVLTLRKELTKTSQSQDANTDYRQLLIKSLHTCAVRFSEVAGDVMRELMNFLGDSSSTSAVDVIAFVREVVERFPDMRENILAKLISSFSDFRNGKVYRGALWVVGDYCMSINSVNEAMQQIRQVLGEVPILAAEERAAEQTEQPSVEDEPSSAPRTVPTTRVRADGTYATESALTVEAPIEKPSSRSKPPLRSLILFGDFYTASVLAATLVKLVLRFLSLSSDEAANNRLRAEAMLIMTSIVRVGQSKYVAATIDEDSKERIMTCLQILGRATTSLDEAQAAAEVFLDASRDAYAHVLQHERQKESERSNRHQEETLIQPQTQLSFRLLGDSKGQDEEIDFTAELSRATGMSAVPKDDFISKLQRVVQLTGFSDPIYAEAYVDVHQFDILLDILVVNQTQETFQNMSVELATLGDLKLVERPSTYTLAPYSFQSIKATIKVSSTETGVIFGNIVYERASGGASSTGDSSYVVLNDIHVDVMDYISPSVVNETQFRSMWTGFEWENKVNVKTNLSYVWNKLTCSDVREYLRHIMKATNMACLTPEASLAGECGFLSANLSASSLFGEDALANVSIERLDDGTIQGHVRIRSKTQGIALSLGDKITLGTYA
ncbi:unnamed protein product [Malassezia sympodialis ATCC 42132]|uniref:uncharacterized protein n=1 Tax=Malassezia sympodialis (strain ATCC 42132) TaxID=1230383 RepID=UPI0002C20474|nr:uncharacterized protein MSY001_0315 [Malassezia sympodialis ATCC 42132]CCU97609.1 unnamed protein product [Malassezia sympodialis ATCC 42132]|eukprot:XP_018738956.1 uncharacterized protein MSY001_0315 [Malassezia sympodialis ATCC 42132]